MFFLGWGVGGWGGYEKISPTTGEKAFLTVKVNKIIFVSISYLCKELVLVLNFLAVIISVP